MGLKKVFMLEDHIYEGDKVLYMDKYYTVESHVADEAIEQGKAISFEGTPELDKYDREIGREVGRFKKVDGKQRSEVQRSGFFRG